MKKKLFLVGIAALLIIAFGCARISSSYNGIKGWVIFGVGLLLYIIAIVILVIYDRRKR